MSLKTLVRIRVKSFRIRNPASSFVYFLNYPSIRFRAKRGKSFDINVFFFSYILRVPVIYLLNKDCACTIMYIIHIYLVISRVPSGIPNNEIKQRNSGRIFTEFFYLARIKLLNTVKFRRILLDTYGIVFRRA